MKSGRRGHHFKYKQNAMNTLLFSSKNLPMKITFLATYLMWLLACGSQSGSADYSQGDAKMTAPAMEESYNQEGGGTGEINLTDQKIIRNGSMTLSVADALEARNQLAALLDKHKAYIGNEQLDNNDYQTNYIIQLRVPAENLDALIGDIESIRGTVTYKSIQARDVTEEYIDLETRLKNKQAYLDQYRALLKNARTMEDILKVQEQIRALEEEIESFTGRLKYLNSQVALSTLDLTINQTKDYVFRPDRKINFFERLKESISGGWYGFVKFSLDLLVLWPFLILIAVMVWIWRRIRRNRRPIPPKVPPAPKP
jgi:hypothetical protein